MDWQDVESAGIESVAYVVVKKLLYVRFKSGTIYAYEKVSKKLVKDLLAADSKGVFFNKNIRNKHQSKKIAD